MKYVNFAEISLPEERINLRTERSSSVLCHEAVSWEVLHFENFISNKKIICNDEGK
jgi:hypothetical protein